MIAICFSVSEQKDPNTRHRLGCIGFYFQKGRNWGFSEGAGPEQAEGVFLEAEEIKVSKKQLVLTHCVGKGIHIFILRKRVSTTSTTWMTGRWTTERTSFKCKDCWLMWQLLQLPPNKPAPERDTINLRMDFEIWKRSPPPFPDK